MSLWLQPEPHNWWRTVEAALDEDIGPGDVTSGFIDPDATVNWYIEAQAAGRLCGVGIAHRLLGHHSSGVLNRTFKALKGDGALVGPGDRIAEGTLDTRTALTVERTVLNFIMHLSGISTLTAEFVRRVEGTGAKIVDTRKTTPGLRVLEKYAVRCGGGTNHRMGLFDGAMLKDNHIKAAGSIAQALKQLRACSSHMTKIEVECESAAQVEEAISCGVDIILLDNMPPDKMREVVALHKGRALFEASGGINLDTVRAAAESGVDLISVGQLTHSAPALPVHMELS